MAPKNKLLKLGLYNAGSLNTGHNDFLVAMDRFDADIVAINETWLKDGQGARAPAPPGYRLRYSPRPLDMCKGLGGGVAFYIKKDIRVRYMNNTSDGIEQMWISTRTNGCSLIIGTAYRPQWKNVDDFLDVLTDSIMMFSHFDHMVLLGDFNINMLEVSCSNTRKLNKFLEAVSLIQVVTDPTHFTADSSSLIDIVCTACPVREVIVSNITGSVGHAMITVVLNLKKKTLPCKTITYRPLKHIDLDSFDRDLCEIDWESINSLSTVDDMVNEFNSKLLLLFDTHAPVRTMRTKGHQSLPWVTDMLKLMIDLREKAHNKYRHTKSERHKKYYKDMKSAVETCFKNEKQAYFNHIINSNVKNSKLFWKNLQGKILLDPSKNNQLPDSYNDPNAINNHFLDIPGNDSVTISDITYFEFNRFGTSTFCLQPVGEATVFNFIKSIDSNATGVDGISRDLILLSLPRTLAIITNIINKSIVTGVVPSQWKKALITPIPKVDKPSNLNDLRPISILPFLSKLLEKSIYYQLNGYIEKHNILPSLQSGFRKCRGTVTALLDVSDNILKEQDDGRGTLLTLLDFSRAFDSINTALLLSKLVYYGFDYHAVKWFDSYLSEREQSVKLLKSDGTSNTSIALPVKRGVPQGSILGPILFIIYSADIVQVIKHSKFHLYADDVQLYISEEPDLIPSTTQMLNEDLGRISEWSNRNALVLNPNKSKYMIVGSKT